MSDINFLKNSISHHKALIKFYTKNTRRCVTKDEKEGLVNVKNHANWLKRHNEYGCSEIEFNQVYKELMAINFIEIKNQKIHA